MFANLLHLLSRRPGSEYELGFVQEVRVRRRPRRNPRMERWIVVGWALILVKSVAVVWAVRHYHIPFSPLWVIAPTVLFAGAVTVIYYSWEA